MSQNKKKNILLGLLLLACLGYLVISLFPISQGIFFFTFDQGRDFLWVKNEFDFHKLLLVGSYGSLEGVFFGPLWLWLLIPLYAVSGGSPVAMTYFNAFVVYLSIFVAFFLFVKKSKLFSIFILLIGTFSLGIRLLAEYAFPQHMSLLLTILLMYSYTKLLESGQKIWFFVALLSISLMFHAEPGTCALSFPSILVLLFFVKDRKKLLTVKTLLLGAGIFLLPFLPQILFDIRHGYVQFFAAIRFLSGQDKSLGGVLPFVPRFIDRVMTFFGVFSALFPKMPIVFSLGILLVTVYVNSTMHISAFTKTIWKACCIFLISFFAASLLLAPALKAFYLDGVLAVFLLIVALSCTLLWKHLYGRIVVSLFIISLFVSSLLSLALVNPTNKDLQERYRAGSIFKNQLQVVTWIYNNAKGQGFREYTYAAAIYDYPYQYLFFTYGLRKYGYLPADFSYLPDKPEYVLQKTEQLARPQNVTRPAGDKVFLIIEPPSHKELLTEWLGNFPLKKYPLVKKIVIQDGTVVEERRRVGTTK